MKKLIIIPLIFLVYTTSAQKYNWSSNDKKEFIQECKKSIGAFMTNSEMNDMCTCALDKIQNKSKNKKESDLLDEDEGLRIIYPCLPKGWSNTVTKMMIEECNQDASEDFCRCYLENLKERFPDFWEFSLLAAEGKISDKVMENLTLPCLE
tara:strand:- start:3 stop:455 length:453 start_codon:yes stop_codon:yes gene_type:complete